MNYISRLFCLLIQAGHHFEYTKDYNNVSPKNTIKICYTPMLFINYNNTNHDPHFATAMQA